MPCACDQCLQHSKTLGLAPSAFSHELIHKAYRDAAKLWHPDRFESAPEQLPEAEEHFKLVQVAYRELTAHQENPVLESSMEGWATPSRSVVMTESQVFVADPFAPKVESPQLTRRRLLAVPAAGQSRRHRPRLHEPHLADLVQRPGRDQHD